MDWKEFFKPTKGKLLVVLFIVLLWPNYIVQNMGCGGDGCQEVLLKVYFFDVILGIGGDPFPQIEYNILNFISSLIVSYSAGSIAIYGLSRLNKKT